MLTSLMALVLMTFTGCKKYEEIKVVSGKMESLNVKGLRTIEASFTVKVDNPAGKVAFEEVNGVLKHSGKVIGNVVVDPVTLSPKTVADYNVKAKFELDKGIGVMYLMTFADVRKLKECTFDLFARCKAAGIRVKKEYKDLPVKNILEEYL